MTRLRFVPRPAARHLPAARGGVAAALRARGRTVLPLVRRGASLGAAVPLLRERPERAEALRRWASAEPVFLPGILGRGPVRHAAAIRASLAMFDRLRRGGTFLAELERRLRA